MRFVEQFTLHLALRTCTDAMNRIDQQVDEIVCQATRSQVDERGQPGDARWRWVPAKFVAAPPPLHAVGRVRDLSVLPAGWRGLGALDYRAIEGARQAHYLPFPRQPIVRPHRSPVGAIHQGASGRRATGARRPPCGTGQDGHAGLHARFGRCDRVPGGLSACSRQRVSRRSTSTSRAPAASGVAWSRSQTSNASASATVASRKPKQARISARNRSAVRAVSSSPSPAGAGASSCSPSASITHCSTADSNRGNLLRLPKKANSTAKPSRVRRCLDIARAWSSGVRVPDTAGHAELAPADGAVSIRASVSINVVRLTPKLRHTAAFDMPSSSAARMASSFSPTITGGRPPTRPRRRAAVSPAITRSRALLQTR